MASKAVALCAFAFLAQIISGQSCHRPLSLPRPPLPSCGCDSDSLSIIFSEREQSCYQPLPVPWPVPFSPVSLPVIQPTSLPSCRCNSDSVSFTLSEGAQSRYQPPSVPLSSANCVPISSRNSQAAIISSPSSVTMSPVYGGGLAVTSIGPITPTGIAVSSNVGLSGDLLLSGVLPYLSAVTFKGECVTSGDVTGSYSCGDLVAINQQIGGNANVGPIGFSVGGRGCGC